MVVGLKNIIILNYRGHTGGNPDSAHGLAYPYLLHTYTADSTLS